MVGQKIKSLMAYEGVKHKEMARRLNISDRTLRRWLQHPDVIQLGYLQIIAKMLGTTLGELMEGEQ